MVDHIFLAFELADKYLIPVMLLADGAIGQMMEKVTLPSPKPYTPDKPWATTGKTADRRRNIITSLYIQSEDMEIRNLKLQDKYKDIVANEVRYQEYLTEDADILIVAYGLSSRIARKTVDMGRSEGLKLGLFRPVTLWPFPYPQIGGLSDRKDLKFLISIEMNAGQMVEDVRLAVCGKKPVHFFGRLGGIVPTPEEVLDAVKSHIEG